MTHFSGNTEFMQRHIAPNAEQTAHMLKTIGVSSVAQLIDETVPANIRRKDKMNIPPALSEHEMLQQLRKMADKNTLYKNYIGLGYYDVIVPGVIQRNILENPGWYTQYTPYQAEIAQGRLEALLNFQTMVTELTGMEIANASLLDEATAAAEAMLMLHAQHSTGHGHKFFVSEKCFPQTKSVLETRAEPLGIEIVYGKVDDFDFGPDYFGVLFQYPDGYGAIRNYRSFCEKAKAAGIYVAVVADLMSLVLLSPPGEWGADVVVGSAQRFGVPMGYGGPHAAFFATRDAFKRDLPGRLIGVSIDSHGNPAFRMALQTREQHIRREKATSNICTAQVLLAIMASMYAVYHGPTGLRNIAQRIHKRAAQLDEALKRLGFRQLNEQYFDTLQVALTAEETEKLHNIAESKGINLNFWVPGQVGISVDETTSTADLGQLISVFAAITNGKQVDLEQLRKEIDASIDGQYLRSSAVLTHPVFNSHHSEHEMLRYIKHLEAKDLSLCHSMIALGSCTMKLNATTEMVPVTWPEFGGLHPFAPLKQAEGYKQLFDELTEYLKDVTGFAGVSLQPNSGAQGEYAGLMVIRNYFKAKGEGHRNIALIPSSAHGTNPASAVMAGMKVVVTKCDDHGNIDLADLREKAELHRDNLAVLMVTYPSTHGVFEESIVEICQMIHANGGQVYMDGANMNAQVGLTSPGLIGADVCHLNLHKTFCIPHGGGGPGMGPIGVAAHLVPFLPGHPVLQVGGKNAMTAVSAAPWGSASILLISYTYIRMMGPDGLTRATEWAILNANYIKARLEKEYPILYTGSNGRCAHEMIVDFRPFKQTAGIEVEDVAKRLMDYGFHAPTVSFPVAGTIMIEPTESEPLGELDRFCEALLQIREEIREVEMGLADRANNVLKHAPHTAVLVTADEWDRPYARSKAAYPASWSRANKFWPSVGRINNTYGDRNLVCVCPPMEAYETA